MPISNALLNLGAGVVSGIGSLITSDMNKRFIEQSNKQQYEYNKKLAEQAFERNMQAWNLQNMYNSPAAQVARLRAAGLNPNEMYGNGTDAAGLASDAPQLSYGDYNPKIPAFENAPGVGINAALSAAQANSMVQLNSAAAFKAEAEAHKVLKDTEWIDRKNEELLRNQRADTYMKEMSAGNYEAMSDGVRENIRKTKLEERVIEKQLPFLSDCFRLANESTAAQIANVNEITKNHPVERAKMLTEMKMFLSQMEYLASAKNLNDQDAIYHSNLAYESLQRYNQIAKSMELTQKQIDAMTGECTRRWITTITAGFRDLGAGIGSIMGVPQFNIGKTAAFGQSFSSGSTPSIYHEYGTPYNFND